MTQHDEDTRSSEELWAEKRQRQAQCFDAMRSGERTQESMFLFPREVVRTFNVRHTRELSWTELET